MTSKYQSKAKLIIEIMNILTLLEQQEYDFDSDTWSHDITLAVRNFYSGKLKSSFVPENPNYDNPFCCGG